MQRGIVGGNVEKPEPEMNLARTLLYVSHSLHSQTRCDLKPGSKSLQQGGQRGFRSRKDGEEVRRLKGNLK